MMVMERKHTEQLRRNENWMPVRFLGSKETKVRAAVRNLWLTKRIGLKV